MTTTNIKGIPVQFPFEPYPLQIKYMEKVIECLQNRQHGVLESPTGTGKTLSLLCSSLAWLEMKKAQIQVQHRLPDENPENEFLKNLQAELNAAGKPGGKQLSGRAFIGLPTIIYASRTHSQLSQAMQELKRSSYKYMRASVLGSRDQLCIEPDVIREQSNALKTHMCRLKVKSRSCHFYNRVERMKNDPQILEQSIVDIEDIVKMGECHKFCPYYMAKELKQRADIIFMPYNYLLDTKVRKVLGVELANNIIILDEAHNIEKVCEESASLQIKSTDITSCIEEITAVMKALNEDVQSFSDQDIGKDFTADDLCILKQMFLDLEKTLDGIKLQNSSEGTNFDGNYIFEMLEACGIRDQNYQSVVAMLDKLVQFLSTVTEGPFQRSGVGLQMVSDLLTVAFTSTSPDFKEKIKKCYKVVITVEDVKQKPRENTWLSKSTASAPCRVLNYWCFSPGFGMNMLIDQNVHCVILTSGTLAPLKPLISELELKVDVQLENPHIVKGDQVCVKILTKGPDMEVLNCNYQNRENPKFLSSLGGCILNLVRIIPDGVLIFFPSYPIMLKCQQYWQQTGIWSNIYEQKAIFVEPRDKISFNNAMTEYYERISNPDYKGAIFMGVCRGKVSEGLDFADFNGRAVIVIGLPYPPLKDPRVILKKRYLNVCNSKDREYLKGDDWYGLEATRAVNQAIGRVIRHRTDYGAIILLDSRFTNFRVKSQMSKWLQQHITVVQNFGEIIRDIRGFFRNAALKFPEKPRGIKSQPAEFEKPQTYQVAKGANANFDFSTTTATRSTSSDFEIPEAYKTSKSVLSANSSNSNEIVSLFSSDESDGEVLIHNRFKENPPKRKKLLIVRPKIQEETSSSTDSREFIIMVQRVFDLPTFKEFIQIFNNYKTKDDFQEFKKSLDEIFVPRLWARHILPGLEPYIKSHHKTQFSNYCLKMKFK